jgi:23S rRNA G2069 N7-methylase RlmK/C1962 C5-methylase RlmI
MANGLARKVIINERAAKRLRDGHVWVYASDVLNDAGAKPGAMVHVIGPKDRFLGSAIYSSSSQIKLRMLGREALRTEEELLQLVRQRLAEGVAYREKVVQNSDASRLIFSEAGDVFTVDRFARKAKLLLHLNLGSSGVYFKDALSLFVFCLFVLFEPDLRGIFAFLLATNDTAVRMSNG